VSEGEASNLSGVWHGQYSYDEPGREAVAFVATLRELGGVLSGSTEETVEIDGAAATLKAALQGKRDGSAVTLLKLYEGIQTSTPGRLYDFVHYAGEVTPEGDEIEGDWRVRGSSGRFLMLRGGGLDAEVAQKAVERV
jgi:hypothetical protein